jgi:vitamin B12 transporter
VRLIPPLILIALCAPSLASADDTARTTLSPAAGEDARFVAGSATRLPLDARGAGTSVAEAMLAAPGVSIQRQSSYGQPAFLSIRGGTPRQLVVLLNGVHVRMPAGLGFDLGSLGADAFASATLWRGPGAAIWGAGALSGALELRTWSPRAPGWSASARTAGGSFGTWEAGARASAARGAWRGAASAAWRASEGAFGFVDGQGVAHQRLNNDHARVQAMGAAGWSTPATQAVQADVVALFEQGEAGVAGPGEFQRSFSQARLADRRLVGAVSWRARDLASGAWGALDAQAGLGLHWRTQRYHNPQTFLGAGTLTTTSALLGLEGSAEPMWSFSALGNTLRARVEGRVEDYAGESSEAGVMPIDVTRWIGAVGASDEQIVGPVTLIGAARVERVSDARRAFLLFTPALGAHVQAASRLVLRASVAQTTRAPDLDELYLQTESVRGDAGLEPERAQSAEVAARFGRARDALGVEVVGFGRRTEQLILFLPVTATLFEATNLPLATALGVEGSAVWSPHRRASLRAVYTFTDATLDGVAGLPVPGQPRHRAQARVDGALGGLAPWVADLQVFGLVDARSAIALDGFGRIENPALVTLDAGLRVWPLAWLEVRLDGRNLLDVRTGVDALQRPLPGRSVYLSLGVSGRGGW